MAEGLLMAAVYTGAGLAKAAGAVTSSHFCNRRTSVSFSTGIRMPAPAYRTMDGNQCRGGDHRRKRWEQCRKGHHRPRLRGHYSGRQCPGRQQYGSCDGTSGGMPSSAVFPGIRDRPRDYDRIFTGDLGAVGSELLCQLLERDHIQISDRHEDCGLLLYDRKKQDVHAGGSGCGCSAGVLNGHILPEMRAGRLHDALFAATGALLSPTMVQQGETIPGIAHLVHLRMEQGGNNGCSSNC